MKSNQKENQNFKIPTDSRINIEKWAENKGLTVQKVKQMAKRFNVTLYRGPGVFFGDLEELDCAYEEEILRQHEIYLKRVERAKQLAKKRKENLNEGGSNDTT